MLVTPGAGLKEQTSGLCAFEALSGTFRHSHPAFAARKLSFESKFWFFPLHLVQMGNLLSASQAHIVIQSAPFLKHLLGSEDTELMGRGLSLQVFTQRKWKT